MIKNYKILVLLSLICSFSYNSFAETADKSKKTKSINEMTADEIEEQVREKVAAENKNKKMTASQSDAFRERFEKNAEDVRTNGQYGTPILSDPLIVSIAKPEYSSVQEVDNFNPLLNKIYPSPPYKNLKNKLYSQQEYNDVVKYLEDMKIANCELKHSGRIDALRELTKPEWTSLQKIRLYQIMKDIGLYNSVYEHKTENLARCSQKAPKSGYEFSKVALVYAMSIHPLKITNRISNVSDSTVTDRNNNSGRAN